MFLKSDLHIHSVLSPCGDWSMSPSAIFEKAKTEHLDIISLTDHNAIENIEALMKCAEQSNLKVIPGIEIQTREDIHMLGYFKDHHTITEFYNAFRKTLPIVKNIPEKMGSQIIVNEKNEVINEMGNFLVVSSSLSIDNAIKMIHDFGGICIASHVDRMAYSIISQLGFIPEGINLDAIETIFNYKHEQLISICNSDAHYIDDIGKRFSIIECKESSKDGFDILFKSIKENSIRCFKEAD